MREFLMLAILTVVIACIMLFKSSEVPDNNFRPMTEEELDWAAKEFSDSLLR